jgi:hypothetical protein
MRQHEFTKADEKNRQWCIHCGALYHCMMDATCIQRPDPPASHRRIERVMDDLDAIFNKIQELKKEKEEAVKNSPS